MGACNSKKPSEPGAQPDMQPVTQSGATVCADAPNLLTDIGALNAEKILVNDAIETQVEVHDAIETQVVASPTSMTPGSPTEGLRTPAVGRTDPMDAPSTNAAVESPAPEPSRTPKEEFELALIWVKDPANTMKGVPNERKLNLYKYFKQAKEGDVKGAQPWAVQIEPRAKWDAWNSVKGMSSEDAMRQYVKELQSQKDEFGSK